MPDCAFCGADQALSVKETAHIRDVLVSDQEPEQSFYARSFNAIGVVTLQAASVLKRSRAKGIEQLKKQLLQADRGNVYIL